MTISRDTRAVLEKVTAGLPPQFLALVALNFLFVGLLLWFMRDTALSRTAAMERVLVSCTQALAASQPGAPPR